LHSRHTLDSPSCSGWPAGPFQAAHCPAPSTRLELQLNNFLPTHCTIAYKTHAS
jgi:hypothetical protein